MPNSVLWVCLVAVWLFVLVPMVIKGRPQILKSTEAAKKTRLLHRGGSRATAPSTARRRSSARHPHDPSWKSSRTATATAVVDEDETETEDDTATEDTEVTTKVRRAADTEVEKPTVEATDDAADDVEDHDADDAAAETDDDLTDETEYDEADSEDAEYEDDSEVAEHDDESEYDEDAEYEDDSETDEFEDEYEDATDELDEDEYDDYARASRHTEAEPESVVDEIEDERPAARTAQPRRAARRSVYSSEKERELKYRERQRVTLGLFVLTILALVSGFLIGTPGWVATGVIGLMLVGYLAYLRRAVKVETQIRAQRLARAKRAQRAEEERRRRAAAVPEFAAAPPPPRLRRPGGAVVLEIDDEDPVFDHLPPFQRRRMDREDLEYRRVG
ncbi:gephyrin-like molybdotransferase receptor GlpR [Gordonia westfalica]|uniref:Transmembrane protein n=1 Tax=Gordonia westfalica TaxID=158898 RepID=A0A1H2JK52_9ACTN|nr:gephyrin-like molybdotransferase receptor GlpR [Gordonia westfalica]SDU56830.1 hypothetical protein SAMN04488548_1342225 [Gordonia westfalica]